MADEQAMRSARGHLSCGEWEAARLVLVDVLAEKPSPEALEGMGVALWWLGRIRESVDHRERAYAAYLTAERRAAAAMVAVDVSVTYLSNLDSPSAAKGWIARARRAAGGDRRLAGWIWLMEGYTAADPQVQRDLLGRALARGRELGDVDLELAALADLGLSLVAGGEVRSGFALLDEAMAGTLGGECERLDTVVWASCSMLNACSLVGDQRRAAEWCAAALRFAASYGGPFLQASCRAHYGRVLVGAGDWKRAETELDHALALAVDCGRGPRVEALAGLAELRLRQGAAEEAERLLEEVGGESVEVLAEVLTALGHPDRAVALLRAELDAPGLPALRRTGLAARLVDALLAVPDVGAAEAVGNALEGDPHHAHPQAAAIIHRARGRVLAAMGQIERATARLRTAATEYDSLGLPFEAARTRLELAQTLAAAEPSLAVVEAGWALGVLERLGARSHAAATAALLRDLGVPTRPGPRELGLLSRREREVLELLQRGLTNPEIAAELYISRKTVAHHVSRILTKLNLRSRAEAAAFAARHTVSVTPREQQSPHR